MRGSTRWNCSDHTKRPSLQDQLVVVLLSLGLFLLVIALGAGAGPMVELVLLLIAMFAVVTINLLFAYSTWEEPGMQAKKQEHHGQHSTE